MPQLIITPKAAEGLEKCRCFLEQKIPQAADRAAEIIRQKFQLLQSQPHIGRPCEIEPLRELIIPFGIVVSIQNKTRQRAEDSMSNRARRS